MRDDLERRLGAYGTAIDEATAADLAERRVGTVDTRPSSASVPVRRPRRLAGALAVLAVVAVTVVAVVTIGGRPHTHAGIGDAPSTAPAASTLPSTTSPPQGLALTPEQKALCTPTCPEEGPPLTPEQAARFATWRGEYDPAEVAYVIRGDPSTDDMSVVETMIYRVGCRETYAALQAAEHAAPDQRVAVVDGIMQPAIAVIEQRNWPPQSQTPQIFEHFATLLENGDFADVSSQVKVGPGSGDCQDALDKRW